MLDWRFRAYKQFRETLENQVPQHILDLWFDGRDEIPLIVDKYELTEWQRVEYGSIQGEIFLSEIRIITLPNVIKERLKIKDQNIADSIALDTAIHMISKGGDYFMGTDNLIKSLGGEDAYWKKFSSDYWNDTITAETSITPSDMKDARNEAKKEISKAENALKEFGYKDSEVYSRAHSIFDMATDNSKSENYDVICDSEGMAKDVIDVLNKGKEKVIEAEKKKRVQHAKESNVSRIRDEITKLEELNKTLTKSVFVGLFFLFLAFALGSFFCYFLFAIIMGINMFYSDYEGSKHEWLAVVVSFPMGFVVAPLLILNWGARDSRNTIIKEKYIECRKLRGE